MIGRSPRTRAYLSRVGLVAATALVAAPLTQVVFVPTAQAAQVLATPSQPTASCVLEALPLLGCSPTVTISGPSGGADGNTTIVVAEVVNGEEGTWLGQTTSNPDGSWQLLVSLPAGSYTMEAFELDTSTGTVGTPSPTVSETVTSNQLVQNGSFESPVVPTGTNGNTWEVFPNGAVPGWDATNACPNNSPPEGIELQTYQTVKITPDDGAQYAELAPNCVSGVTQTISTVPGTQYTLTFAYMARPSTAASQNTMAVQWGGAYIAGSSQTGSGLQGGATWQLATYNLTATNTSTVLEFDDTDPVLADSVGDFLDDVSVVPTASLAPANTSWFTAQQITLAPASGPQSGNASQSLTFSGETLWYDFPVQPGEQVSVQLSNPGDYQLLLFSDISQAAASGAGANGIPVTQAESASNNDSAANFSPAYENPAYDNPAYENPAYENPAYDNPAYENPAYENPAYDNPAYDNPAYDNPAYDGAGGNAVVDSLLAESLPAGSTSQSAQANTWNATGNFYVEVVSDDGGFSSTPYTVTVTASGGACSGALQSYTADLNTANNGGGTLIGPSPVNSNNQPYSTVIVDNSTAMPQVSPSYSGAGGISSSLAALASFTKGSTPVNGVILDVAQSKGIQELMSQAQANPACPYAENLEAQGIQDLINMYRAYGTGGTPDNNLQDVVIVGDDDVIPFFRYADAETIGPEDTYQVPLSSTSAPEAALENDYYLTDDQYGAASELDINNTLLPIQSAAVGRLVETPADIQNAINNYLGNPVIKPTSTLATGYSFMAQGATEVGQYFADGVPAGPNGPSYNDTLIDTPPNGTSWSATDLQTALTTRPHQLVFLGAHFNANVALAADDSTYLTTNQFAASIGNNLQNSLVVSTGCHSGYTIDPQDATPLTDTLSWPQAMTEAGATLIAGTGYQFGDSNYVAYSGEIYVDLAQQLYQTAGKSVAVGTALLDAESQYLASLDQLNGLEEKALLQVTLYGIPTMGVQEPNTASTSPVSSPSTKGVVSTASNLATGGPAAALMTTEYDLPVNGLSFSSYTPPGQPGTALSYDTLPQADYSQGQSPQSQVVADPGAPIVPVLTEDVNIPGSTLTGVGFFGGNYTDTSGQPPLTGDPVTDTSQLATPFSSPVFLPERLSNPNYFGTLDTGAGTELGITPEQYVTDPSMPSNAIKREYNSVDFHLFYSPSTSLAALAAPPQISGVTATEDSFHNVMVSAVVPGGPYDPVQTVWVTWTDPPSGGGAGTWASVPLTQSTTNPDLWTGPFTDGSASNAVFEVQAANGAGEVSLDNNGGYYFSPTLLSSTGAPPPSPAGTSLSLSGDTTDVFGTTASVSATLTATASAAAIGGQQVTFSLGRFSVSANTGTNGSASVNIPLANLQPGPYTLTASYNGNPMYAPVSTSEAFNVTKATTELVSLMPQSGQIVSGAPNTVSVQLTSSGGTDIPQKTVYFELTDPKTGAVVAGGTGETNDSGVAYAGVTVPYGDVGQTYVLSAYFGTSSLALPGNITVNASDQDYAASSTTSTSPPSGPSVTIGSDLSQTLLAVSPTSFPYGQPVTLSATASLADAVSVGDPVGLVPVPSGDGTMAFDQDGMPVPSCTSQPVSSGKATCVLTGVPAGQHQFTAIYSGYPGSPNAPIYLGSTSAPEAATATTQTCITTTQSTLSVAKGQAACLAAGGKITGSVTVASGGALWVTGGSIGGSVSASGATAISISGATITGSVSVTGTTGPVSIGSDSIGGSLSLSNNKGGLSLGNDHLTGSVALSGNSGGVAITGDTIGGSVSVSGNSGGVAITGGTIGGSVSVSGNAGGLTFTNDKITGSVTVANNTGGVTFTGNTVGGSATLTGNSGGFTYSNNTVHGSVTKSNNT